MMKIVIVAISFFCLAATKKSDYTSIWKHVNPEGYDSFEHYSVKKDEVIIPFLWSNIKKSDIEELIQKNVSYDSLMEKYNNDSSAILSEAFIKASMLHLSDKIIKYDGRRSVNLKNKKIPVYRFAVYRGNEINEDAYYRLYYSSDFGIISCLYEVYGESIPGIKENKYILIEMNDKNAKSVFDKFFLNEILKQLDNTQ